MFSALFSFLGGSAFRAIWGEVSEYFKARQDHRYEIERLRLQGEMDAAQHSRNLEAIKVQADMGVKVIEVQGEMDVARIEADAWSGLVKESVKPTGLALVDTWNGVIRPLCATIAVMLWVVALGHQGFAMGEWDRELVGAILGFFFASRVLAKK